MFNTGLTLSLALILFTIGPCQNMHSNPFSLIKVYPTPKVQYDEFMKSNVHACHCEPYDADALKRSNRTIVKFVVSNIRVDIESRDWLAS